MADVSNAIIVSKESPHSDLTGNFATECSDTNNTNTTPKTPTDNLQLSYQEIESFSEISFKTGDDELSLQDLIESEFEARISNFSAVSSPCENEKPLLKENLINQEIISCESVEPINAGSSPDGGADILVKLKEETEKLTIDFEPTEVNGISEFVTEELMTDENADNDDGFVQRPANIPILSVFDPFARIEEDSETSNSNPLSTNMINSPDEFSFPESPHGGEKIVDLFVKTITDESDLQISPSDKSPTSFPELGSNDQQIEDLNTDETELETNVAQIRLSRVNDGNAEITVDASDDRPTDWTNVGDLMNDIVADGMEEGNAQSESDSNESMSETRTIEKKSSKKKKSIESGSKRVKKTKKSEEKENISVNVCDLDVEPMLASSETLSVSPTFTPNPTSLAASVSDADDLENVCVKDRMSTYCSEAAKSFQSKLDGEEIIPAPVPIQNLKTCSMGDLRSNSNKVAVLRTNLVQTSISRSTNSLSANVGRCPIVTGVSVQTLKERYCSVVGVPKEDPVRTNRKSRLSVPWSESLKSSFSKFDQLAKKSTVLHVRSVDAGKVQKFFNDGAAVEPGTNCKSCGKQVFQMEQIKAERALWHKNCFRCKECSKQLTVDTYSSHEGVLYCKPHFKDLFKPKAVLEDEPELIRFRKPEMIIRENQPVELPPEVVRASDKPDLGLEELSSLNVKSRFQVFEKTEENHGELEYSPSAVSVKRSPSILSKLAKFQKKGMDIGVSDDSLNGVPYEQSSSSSEEEEEDEEEEDSKKNVIKSKKIRERPISFGKMDDVKSVWENGISKTKEELREERKLEVQQIRSKLFMGKQVRMKEAYEQAVRESEQSGSPRKNIDVRCEKAKSIKESFEKGEPLNVNDEDDSSGDSNKKNGVTEDSEVFEAGISKKSRSLFLELDKSAKNQQTSFKSTNIKTNARATAVPSKQEVQRQSSDNVVRASDSVEEVAVNSAEISNKFKFFETYKAPAKEKRAFRITPPREGQVKMDSPEREVNRDPNIIRASDPVEPEIVRTNTTTKMLSLFRQMEERTEDLPDGPKPLKRFTPPPDYKENGNNDSDDENEDEDEEEDEEEEEEEEDEHINPNLVRASDKLEDDYLQQAAKAARTKQLRAKFEKWEEKERERERAELADKKLNGNVSNDFYENDNENIEVTSIECTKNIRARFEQLRAEAEQPKEKQRPKVNRFVKIQNSMAEMCDVCWTRVYQLEKIEASGKIFHKTCFRCDQCKCLLRLETFTWNCGRLYCMPHFKQLFTFKGNYDEGFGVNQHKAKWASVPSC